MHTKPVFNTMNLKYNPMKSVRPDIYQILPEEDVTKKMCVHCGTAYFEYENLGQLNCFIHPGVKIYDVTQGKFTYSCCGTDQSIGCLEVDHMDKLLNRDDAQKRKEELKVMAMMIMPQILTQFGYMRPQSENILMWLDTEPPQKLFLQRKWPYSSSQRDILSLNSEEAMAKMSKQLESQAYLKELLTLDRKELTLKQEKREKLNERWRTELNRNTDGRAIKLNFVPLLVIRRLEI